MASSFPAQIPGIIHIIRKLNPASVLDIGKGFGKYGFLIHEYAGIDNKKRIDGSLTLKELSSINIDVVEADEDLMLPYLKDIYSNIYFGDVTKILTDFFCIIAGVVIADQQFKLPERLIQYIFY